MGEVIVYSDPPEWYDDVPRSITRQVTFGILLMIFAFGGFGLWAFKAPLAAAVISQGSFVATGSNKIVQHLEGGIINKILVEEGEDVEAGQPLLLLDETVALATERELFLRQVRLEAMEARILAEYNQQDELTYPLHIEELRSDFSIASMLDGQEIVFEAATRQLQNDINLLQQSVNGLAERARGYEQQRIATQQQLEILNEDSDAKKTLLDKGLIRRTEFNTLRRAMAEATGQIGRLESEIKETQALSMRYESQIEQTMDERQGAALDELQIVQSELESVREQARKAQNILHRAEILAPVSYCGWRH
jgi:HlyD family type I secretion membrane fusion protein